MRILTPKQELFLSSYTDPKSETFGNALQSALKAGYKQEYSEQIIATMPAWLSENIGSLQMLTKAEENIKEVQGISIKDDKGKVDSHLLRERSKVDLFIAERLGKRKYSLRTEMTGADGKDLKISVVKYGDNTPVQV